MKVDPDVLKVLDACRTDGNKLMLPGALNRKLYLDVNKVLEAAGGKWSRGAKCHLFDDDAAERIDQIIATGDVVVPKDDFDYFPTPPVLARQMVAMLQIPKGGVVLEPSAGTGSLINALLDSDDSLRIMAVEKNPSMAAGLRMSFPGLEVSAQDFMAADRPAPVFDAVCMNPPFANRADIHHTLHAIRFLKPGGRLVSILSAGVLFRQDRLATQFRQTIDDMGGAIKPLPEGSFKASGTSVNTALLLLEKAP